MIIDKWLGIGTYKNSPVLRLSSWRGKPPFRSLANGIAIGPIVLFWRNR